MCGGDNTACQYMVTFTFRVSAATNAFTDADLEPVCSKLKARMQALALPGTPSFEVDCSAEIVAWQGRRRRLQAVDGDGYKGITAEVR